MKNQPQLPWIIGIIVTIFIAWNGIATSTNASQNDVLRNHEGKIAGIEAKLERIPIIEGKLDAMLETRSINPREVERIVEQKLSLKLASTTE